MRRDLVLVESERGRLFMVCRFLALRIELGIWK